MSTPQIPCPTTTSCPTIYDVSALQGTWNSYCYTISGITGVSTFGETVTFSGSTLTITDYFFSDSLCQTEYFRATMQSSFNAGSASSTCAMRNLDITQSSQTQTPKTTSCTNSFNSSSECSLTNWSTDTANSIAGRSCSILGSVASNGTAFYNIVGVNGTTLYFGTTWATSSGSRPTAKDTNYPYFKQ